MTRKGRTWFRFMPALVALVITAAFAQALDGQYRFTGPDYDFTVVLRDTAAATPAGTLEIGGVTLPLRQMVLQPDGTALAVFSYEGEWYGFRAGLRGDGGTLDIAIYVLDAAGRPLPDGEEAYADARELPDPDARDADGYTALHRAAFEGDAFEAGRLLQLGANVNAAGGPAGITPLHAAVYVESLDVTLTLLAAGADTEVRDADGWTPLHAGASRGSAAAVAALLAAGVDPEPRDVDGDTPLHEAVRRAQAEVALLLLDHGANPETRNNAGQTALHQAAFSDDTAVTELLLAAGGLAGARDESGFTPLHQAAADGSVNAARALLAGGADLEATGDFAMTPLHLAAYFDQAAMIRLLVQHGADMAALTDDGSTPLAIARSRAGAAVVEALLEAGAPE